MNIINIIWTNNYFMIHFYYMIHILVGVSDYVLAFLIFIFNKKDCWIDCD